jgi:hypothetical protein
MIRRFSKFGLALTLLSVLLMNFAFAGHYHAAGDASASCVTCHVGKACQGFIALNSEVSLAPFLNGSPVNAGANTPVFISPFSVISVRAPPFS